MAIFVKYGDVKGEVKVDGFKDWMQMESVQWGLGRGIAAATPAAAAEREVLRSSVSEITCHQEHDTLRWPS